MKRAGWDATWMAVAETIARRSLCARAQIGCVIVDHDQRVISLSYAGPSPGFDHRGKTCETWCERYASDDRGPVYPMNCTTHAEVNAIVRADWSRLDGATLYVNGSVCRDCARAIAQTRLRRVSHRVDSVDLHRDPDAVEAFLRDRGFEVDRW